VESVVGELAEVMASARRTGCRGSTGGLLRLAWLAFSAAGCTWLGPGTVAPPNVIRWQDTTPPTALLREKAARYQERLEARHLTPEGVLRYQIKHGRADDGSYGDLADGPFHTGIYLASQAFRFAATSDPAARHQVLRALDGLRTLHDVTGCRGLLARYISPTGRRPGDGGPSSEQPADSSLDGTRRMADATGAEDDDKAWRPSTAMPGFAWRGDVSKDQYAGFIHGLGVALALVPDPEVRARVAELSSAAADHLEAHHMKLIDANGQRTTHGNLAGYIAGVPIGVNSLIALAIAKVAAVSTGEARYEAFYDRLVRAQYPEAAYWAHFTVLGVVNRVNDNMSYLALYPILLLETRKDVLSTLRSAEARTWRAVCRDRNAFFAFVHASQAARSGGDEPDGLPPGREEGRESLREFPEDKLEWPVDLTREGFLFERSFLNTRKGDPRAVEGVPLYLRSRSSSFWASDPFRLVGNLARTGDHETAGGDYLLAYWMGRYHCFIGADE
jgi:hypothetical protein